MKYYNKRIKLLMPIIDIYNRTFSYFSVLDLNLLSMEADIRVNIIKRDYFNVHVNRKDSGLKSGPALKAR